jgi:hypothetical protein
MKKPKEPSVSIIAKEAHNKYQINRSNLLTTLIQHKNVKPETLSWNINRNCWLVSTTDGKRLTMEEALKT